jgi:hypothetical protein
MNNNVAAKNDEIRTAVREAAQKWGERMASLGDALSQLAQAVAASLAPVVKAIAEVARKLYDLLWQQYLGEGAIYGRTHEGMMKWLGEAFHGKGGAGALPDHVPLGGAGW